MAKKPTMSDKDLADDPLQGLSTYDPQTAESLSAETPHYSSEPVSPLGPPRAVASPGITPIESVLQEAQRQIEQLQAELAVEREARRDLEKKLYQLEASANQAVGAVEELERERQIRVGLEREFAVMETEMKHAQAMLLEMDKEREARLDLERKIGSLELRAENTMELADELSQERKARVELERQTATLTIEVQHAKKLDNLLSEERQARANAQMRASTAEAKLAQLEGERSRGSQGGRRSFWGRLRGG